MLVHKHKHAPYHSFAIGYHLTILVLFQVQPPAGPGRVQLLPRDGVLVPAILQPRRLCTQVPRAAAGEVCHQVSIIDNTHYLIDTVIVMTPQYSESAYIICSTYGCQN